MKIKDIGSVSCKSASKRLQGFLDKSPDDEVYACIELREAYGFSRSMCSDAAVKLPGYWLRIYMERKGGHRVVWGSKTAIARLKKKVHT